MILSDKEVLAKYNAMPDMNSSILDEDQKSSIIAVLGFFTLIGFFGLVLFFLSTNSYDSTEIDEQQEKIKNNIQQIEDCKFLITMDALLMKEPIDESPRDIINKRMEELKC